MMTLLILIAIVLVVLALVAWLIDSAPLGDSRIKWALKALAIIAAIWVIASRVGLG